MRDELFDTDLIGRHGQTVVATWPGPGYAVERFALERSGDDVYLVADRHILDRFALPDLAAAFSAFYALDPLPLATIDFVMSAFELDVGQ